MLKRTFLRAASWPYSLSLLITTVSVSGCLPTIQTERKDQVAPEQIAAWDELAEDYFIEDLGCQENEGLSDVGAQNINQFGGGATQPKSHSFEGFSSNKSIIGPGISASYYNFHQLTQCKNENGVEVCNSGSQVVSQSKSLKICRQDSNYARASIEGVALSSISSLDDAYRFYLSIPNAKASLRKASVIVLPIVERQTKVTEADGAVTTTHSMMTDNLAYTPSFDGSPAFVVYPKSRAAVQKGRWKNLNLWELPWGMAHEFGHHVFRSHTGIEKVPTSVASNDTTHQGFDPSSWSSPIHSIDFDEDDKSSSGFALTGRTVGPTEIFGAINEGYADLYSYYALGQSSTLTEGVDCFEKNRDITSTSFLNGDAKRLDESAISTFFASARVKANSCNGPDFQDIHTIGAVIAYGIRELFEARAAEANAQPTDQAGWLLSWAEAIGDKVRSGGSAAVNFEDLLALAIKGVSESDGTLTGKQCEIIRSVFPAYADQWLSGTFTCK